MIPRDAGLLQAESSASLAARAHSSCQDEWEILWTWTQSFHGRLSQGSGLYGPKLCHWISRQGMAWKPRIQENSTCHGAFPAITTIMCEALNLKVFRQSYLGVLNIMTTEPRKLNSKHACRIGAELAPVMGQMGSSQTLSMCSECVLAKASCPAGRKNRTLAVKSILPQVQILLFNLSNKVNRCLWRIMGWGFLNLACWTLYKWGGSDPRSHISQMKALLSRL